MYFLHCECVRNSDRKGVTRTQVPRRPLVEAVFSTFLKAKIDSNWMTSHFAIPSVARGGVLLPHDFAQKLAESSGAAIRLIDPTYTNLLSHFFLTLWQKWRIGYTDGVERDPWRKLRFTHIWWHESCKHYRCRGIQWYVDTDTLLACRSCQLFLNIIEYLYDI